MTQAVTFYRQHHSEPLELLLAEDSPSDAGLTLEALKRSTVANNAHHVSDGVELLAFLRRHDPFSSAPRPDLILLDLNMPRMDGHEVLATLLNDKQLRSIPVIVLTTSDSEEDVVTAYQQKASCYIRKPVGLDGFLQAMREIDAFWFQVVRLPQAEHSHA